MAKKRTGRVFTNKEMSRIEKAKLERRTYREPDFKASIKTRINRLNGQLKGICNMVDDDRYTDDLLIQLSAVDVAIKNLANLIVKDHIENYVGSELLKGNRQPIESVIELIKRFQ